jgi:hypothetical protein
MSGMSHVTCLMSGKSHVRHVRHVRHVTCLMSHVRYVTCLMSGMARSSAARQHKHPTCLGSRVGWSCEDDGGARADGVSHHVCSWHHLCFVIFVFACCVIFAASSIMSTQQLPHRVPQTLARALAAWKDLQGACFSPFNALFQIQGRIVKQRGTRDTKGGWQRTRSCREPNGLVDLGEANVEIDHQCCHVVVARRRLHPHIPHTP